MPKSNAIVLLTRPLIHSLEFAKMLGVGVKTVISPVIKIQNTKCDIEPNRYDAFIFASRNGVLAASSCFDLQGKQAITVGHRTNRAAETAGMISVSAEGTSDDLVAKVIDMYPKGKVLFLHGKHTTGEVVKKLRHAGVKADSAQAYDQVECPLSPLAQNVICGEVPVVIPLFSARSCGLVASRVREFEGQAPIVICGMGKSVLENWNGPVPLFTGVADRPTAQGMKEETLRLIDRLP